MKQWLLDNWFLVLTAAVAVYGAVLATVAGVQARRLQRAMSKEEVSLTAFHLPSSGRRSVCVEVVNSGQCDVFIRDVTLRHRESPKDQGVPFITQVVLPHPALTPGDSRTYMSPEMGFEGPFDAILQKIRAASPDDVWIVVQSNKGELARIEGAEVLRVIDELLSSTN